MGSPSVVQEPFKVLGNYYTLDKETVHLYLRDVVQENWNIWRQEPLQNKLSSKKTMKMTRIIL